jgi:hypothetical protein
VATANCAVSAVPLATLMLLTVIPAPALTCVMPFAKLVDCPRIVSVTICPGEAVANDVQATIGVLASSS